MELGPSPDAISAADAISARHRPSWLRRMAVGLTKGRNANDADEGEIARDRGLAARPSGKLHLVFATVERASELCHLLETARRWGEGGGQCRPFDLAPERSGEEA